MNSRLDSHPWSRALLGFLIVLVLVGCGVWIFVSRARPVSVPILMYHKIGNAEDSPWWVRAEDFASQLQCLREQGYTSVVPSDLAAHQRWGWPLPPKPVLITFDDGYLNLLENAEPLLKQYGFRAVCYLITSRIGDSPETRQSWEGTPLLTWPEVRAMNQRGVVVFGGHSRTHANLRALANPQEEIAGCYRDLRKKGGFRPEGFCYPYGQYKETTVACVARTKFTSATTCEDGIAETGRGLNLLELPRVSVMGGLRRFEGHAVAAGTNQVSICVALEGQRLEVCPRLTWKDRSGESRERWLESVPLSKVPCALVWDVCERELMGAAKVELWDQFHVLRYWQVPLSTLSQGS
jgi:peptidoglycan/xylan/chitin deacetylase (PgdA/CDA1 family)